MNCTICGSPFIIGSDPHAACRVIEKQRAEAARSQEERITELERQVEILLADWTERHL